MKFQNSTTVLFFRGDISNNLSRYHLTSLQRRIRSEALLRKTSGGHQSTTPVPALEEALFTHRGRCLRLLKDYGLIPYLVSKETAPVQVPMRLGSAQAGQLFRDGDRLEFSRLYRRYDACIAAVAAKKKRPELVALTAKVGSVNRQDSMSLKDLSDLTKFKLIRGKMRPIQHLVDSNNPAKVESVTEKAFGLLRSGKWESGLCLLANELHGVGIATSSYIGAAVRPDICASMSDEVLEACGLGRDYDLATYCVLRSKLSQKADALNHNAQPGDERWDLEMVGKALWACATCHALNVAPDSSPKVTEEEEEEEEEVEEVKPHRQKKRRRKH